MIHRDLFSRSTTTPMRALASAQNIGNKKGYQLQLPFLKKTGLVEVERLNPLLERNNQLPTAENKNQILRGTAGTILLRGFEQKRALRDRLERNNSYAEVKEVLETKQPPAKKTSIVKKVVQKLFSRTGEFVNI
jgi:hypothetical protein